MDYINHNTSLRTNKHLSYEERFYIEKQLQAMSQSQPLLRHLVVPEQRFTLKSDAVP